MQSEKYPISGKFLLGRLRHAMTEHEEDLLEGLFDAVEEAEHEQVLMQRGQLYDKSTMLIEGFAMRTIQHDGNTQIVGFQVPGDFIDLHAFALKRLDHSIVALGKTKVAYVPHNRLHKVMDQEPHLARLLWFSTLLDAAIHREWIMKLGNLRAIGRGAHFLAEVYRRLEMVGRAQAGSFDTPLNQRHLANICGTTPVHINRVVRDLKEAGLAEFQRGHVTIINRQALEKEGHFDPSYLYGEGDFAIGDELDIGQAD